MTDAHTPAAEMSVLVNGEPRSCARGATVTDLLRQLRFRSEHVAVERNKQLVRRAEHASTVLHEGDHIEVVSFFGGG